MIGWTYSATQKDPENYIMTVYIIIILCFISMLVSMLLFKVKSLMPVRLGLKISQINPAIDEFMDELCVSIDVFNLVCCA